MEPEADYESWAINLCALLDKIELANDDSEVAKLCGQRFEIARKHGLTVMFGGEGSGLEH